MRVGGATRTTLRSVLESWNLGDRSDSVLDAAVRELRQTGSARSDTVEKELEVFTPAFLSLGRLGVKLLPSCQQEEWVQFLWELWEAASGGVQTQYRLVHLCEDDESWQAACTTLGEFLELELQAAVRPTWSKVEAIFSALLFDLWLCSYFRHLDWTFSAQLVYRFGGGWIFRLAFPPFWQTRDACAAGCA